MDKPVTFAICGLGIRGLEAYAAFQKQHPEKMKITAGADPDPDRRAALQANYGVPAGSCFATGEELLAQPRLADVMIIATQDRQHVAQALAALDKGYHLVLEKPISPLLDECLALQKKAHEANRVVVVCHVLCAIPNSTARCTSCCAEAPSAVSNPWTRWRTWLTGIMPTAMYAATGGGRRNPAP